MLVLTRKLGEKIVIPTCGLTITVVAVKGEAVRLGFTAPPGVTIHREEVWWRIAREREAGTGEGVPCTDD
jgi:carbon storage regulator